MINNIQVIENTTPSWKRCKYYSYMSCFLNCKDIIYDESFKYAKKNYKEFNITKANNSELRKDKEMFLDVFIGRVAENISLWYYKDLLGLNAILPEMTDKSNQIDLIVNNKLIEIRSSFCNNRLYFSVYGYRETDNHTSRKKFYGFDVIGKYTTLAKPNEKQKDFYQRIIYPYSFDEFVNILKNKSEFEVCLLGGSDYETINNHGVSKFMKKDNTMKEGNYQTYPIIDAYDLLTLTRIIRGV